MTNGRSTPARRQQQREIARAAWTPERRFAHARMLTPKEVLDDEIGMYRNLRRRGWPIARCIEHIRLVREKIEAARGRT